MKKLEDYNQDEKLPLMNISDTPPEVYDQSKLEGNSTYRLTRRGLLDKRCKANRICLESISDTLRSMGQAHESIQSSIPNNPLLNSENRDFKETGRQIIKKVIKNTHQNKKDVQKINICNIPNTSIFEENKHTEPKCMETKSQDHEHSIDYMQLKINIFSELERIQAALKYLEESQIQSNITIKQNNNNHLKLIEDLQKQVLTLSKETNSTAERMYQKGEVLDKMLQEVYELHIIPNHSAQFLDNIVSKFEMIERHTEYLMQNHQPSEQIITSIKNESFQAIKNIGLEVQKLEENIQNIRSNDSPQEEFQELSNEIVKLSNENYQLKDKILQQEQEYLQYYGKMSEEINLLKSQMENDSSNNNSVNIQTLGTQMNSIEEFYRDFQDRFEKQNQENKNIIDEIVAEIKSINMDKNQCQRDTNNENYLQCLQDQVNTLFAENHELQKS